MLHPRARAACARPFVSLLVMPARFSHRLYTPIYVYTSRRSAGTGFNKTPNQGAARSANTNRRDAFARAILTRGVIPLSHSLVIVVGGGGGATLARAYILSAPFLRAAFPLAWLRRIYMRCCLLACFLRDRRDFRD